MNTAPANQAQPGFKNAVDGLKLLMSGAFRARCERYLRAITGNYKNTLVFAPGMVCTDGEKVWADPASGLIVPLELVQKIIAVRGQIAHEAFHILYTSFTSIKRWAQEAKRMTPEDQFRLYQRKDFLNIVEDSAIELAGCTEFPGLAPYIRLLNDTAFDHMQELGWYEENKNRLRAFMNACMMYGIIGQVKGAFTEPQLVDAFERAKPHLDEGRIARTTALRQKESDAIWEIAKPFMEEAILLGQLQDMFQNLKGNDMDEKGNGQGRPMPSDTTEFRKPQKQKGGNGQDQQESESDEDQDDDDSSDGSKSKSKSDKKDKKKDKDKSKDKSKSDSSDGDGDQEQDEKGDGGSGEEEDEKDASNKDDQDGSGSGSDEESDDEEKGDKSGSKSNDDSDEDEDPSSDSKNSGNGDDEEDEEPEADGPDADADGDSDEEDESDKDSDADSDGDGDKGLDGGDTDSDSDKADSDSDTDSDTKNDRKQDRDENQLAKDSNDKAVDDADAAADQNASDEADQLMKELEDEILKEIGEVVSEMDKEANAKSQSEIRADRVKNHLANVKYAKHHENIRVKPIHFTPTDFEKAQLKPLEDELEPLTRSMAKRLQNLIRYNEEEKRSGMTDGHLNQSQLWRKDGKIFSQKKDKNDEADLVIGLIIDESGSMGAYSRDKYAKRAAVILVNVCDRLKIPVAVTGHQAVGNQNVVEHFHYVTCEKPVNEQKANLVKITSRDNTREGVTLKYAAEYLMLQPQKDKLLLVISDGDPQHSAYGGRVFGGEPARIDAACVVEEYERKGVTTIGISIGEGQDLIAEIYKNFISINKLESLPQKLVSLLEKRIFKN